MARGDVVSEIASTANGSSLTYQPSSGVESVIKVWSGERSGTVYLEIYDGTNACIVCDSFHYSDEQLNLNMTIPINNAHYFRIRNASGSTLPLMYSGYITNAG